MALPAPSSDSGYHIAPKYWQDESNEPKLDGVRRLIGVPMATFQLHHQTRYHIAPKYCSIIRLWHIVPKLSRRIKRAQTRWGCRLITEFLWPPSSSIIRLWLPYSIKVLGKTNQTSPNSMGLRRLITEFLWPPSSSIIRLWLPYSTKVLGKTNQTSPNSMGLR
ncbi:hypothetical protein EVAR_96189_1 [Eumeta japonica]|uniref:Uncharacterized protein n=1 Tax=Eumeta variegata TaxID=151549 RepID=A0A4C1VJW4_EUMVA|nr:hypothetical protein EVAR_96189_1 [Eumeta japonica]